MEKFNVTKKLCLAAILVLVLGSLLCLAVGAETHTGTCGADGDNLTWSLDTESGELVIEGTGAMIADYRPDNTPWYSYRSSIKTVTIGDEVTSIGKYAFLGFTSLPSITIGDSVTSIGVDAFNGCTALEEVTIPNSMISIGNNAFFNCTALANVTIPESVTSIGYAAFYGCSSLTSVTILSKTATIYDSSAPFPTSTTIYGYAGSTAEAYAAKYGRTFVALKEVLGSGTCGAEGDNLTWELFSDGELVISGTGAMKNYASGSSTPWSYYRESIKTVTIENGVTSIGNCAFFSCTAIPSVTIPSSVTTIGDWAFAYWDSLMSVNIPEGVTSIGVGAFEGCLSLAGVSIPESVVSIDKEAFVNCTSLESVTIPEGVTSIGEKAFFNCSSLTSVTILSKTAEIYDSQYTFPTGATIYGYEGSTAEEYATKYNRTFVALEEEPEFLYSGTCGDTLTWGLTADGELIISGTGAMTEYVSEPDVPWHSYRNSVHTVTIKDGVTSIGNYAFTGCSTLTIVTIPEGVTSIGIYAFYECSSLTSVTIPEGVTSIGWWAFYHCSSLASITIPEDVTEIGHFMFEGCSSLTNVTIPDSVTVIGTHAFYECSSLVSLTIGEGVTYITEYAFGNCTDLASITVDADNSVYYSENNCIIEKANKMLIVGCKNSVIPKGVRSIGSGAFYGCSSLTSVTIPEGVKYMGSEVFAKCSSLANVTIPESMTNSGFNTFAECSSLESVTVLSKTVQIYDAADTISDTATIYGYAGSTAEAYANKYDRTFVALKEFLYSGTCGANGDNLTWGLTEEGELVIEGTGAMAYYESRSDVPWDAHRSSINTVTISADVTFIGRFAFCDCTALTNVVIPDGVTQIGDHVFNGCTALASVSIPSTVNKLGAGAFGGCTALTSITLPEDVSFLGFGMFRGCTNLTDIVIPESLTGITGYVFRDCDSLNTSVYGGAKYIGTATNPYLILVAAESDETTECHVHPDTKMIDGGALSACTSLTTLTVDEGNTVYYSAGNCIINKATGALVSGCKTSVIPNDGSITEIYRYAFMDCSALESITIPESVTSIGTYAFRDCTKLSTVTIPRSVTSIAGTSTDGDAFSTSTTIYGYEGSAAEEYAKTFGRNFVSLDTNGMSGTCGEKLTWALTEDGVLTISGTGAMTNCKELSMPWYSHRDSIKTVIIESGVTSIGSWAFYGCTALENVTIPESVTSIGSYTFRYCSNLASVTIPEGVTWIGAVAFEYCSALTSVNIPEGVTTIGASTFAYCSALTELTIPESVTAIGQYAFKNCFGFTEVTIPKNLTSIGNGAFAACKNIASLTVDADNSVYYSENNCIIDRASKTLVLGCKNSVIPEDVTAIGVRAFRGCEGLVSVTIPEGVTSIEEYAFNGCTALRSITIPESVTSIGSYAFGDCDSLTSVTVLSKTAKIYNSNSTFPTGATISGYEGSTAETYAKAYGRTLAYLDANRVIGVCGAEGNNLIWAMNTESGELVIEGTGAMADYSAAKSSYAPWYPYRASVKSITIGDEVTSIGKYAFYGCTALTSITIPKGVASIGIEAFSNCVALDAITVAEDNTVYHSAGNCLIETATGTLVVGCNTSVIPTDGSVTSIGGWAFFGCVALDEIIIPDSVTSIGTAAFQTCKSLVSVRIPESVAFISQEAFNACSALAEIVILSKTVEIEDDEDEFATIPENATIYGYAGSTAQGYATEYGRTFVALKDQAKTTLRVVSGEVKAGDSITVDVVIENNAGFAYLEVTPVLPSGLTLSGVTNGTLITDFEQGKQYLWIADSDVTENGTLLSLTFATTADTAEGTYAIDFIVRMSGNMDEEEVDIDVVSGEITVVDFVWGDATGDGKINGFDIIRLKKYLAAYDYDTETSTVEIAKGADATGDGKINGFDIIRLKKYLAAYDYDTESSTVTLGPSK